MKNPFKNSEIKDTTEETTEEIKDTEEELSKDNESQTKTDNFEIEKLQEKYDNLNNQYMRLAADFENYRKRQEAERESLLRFGLENALTKLLEVLDNFERAKKSLENIEDIEKYKESLELLNKQTIDTLTKLGMEPINAQGQTFDPNIHDAVMQTPTDEYPEHTVIAELQKGYKLGDKILRPSLVNVATAQ